MELAASPVSLIGRRLHDGGRARSRRWRWHGGGVGRLGAHHGFQRRRGLRGHVRRRRDLQEACRARILWTSFSVDPRTPARHPWPSVRVLAKTSSSSTHSAACRSSFFVNKYFTSSFAMFIFPSVAMKRIIRKNGSISAFLYQYPPSANVSPVRLQKKSIESSAIAHALATYETLMPRGANDRGRKSRDSASTIGTFRNVRPSVMIARIVRPVLRVHLNRTPRT